MERIPLIIEPDEDDPSTLDRSMDLILGYTTLRQADWLFDFPARRWAITRRPDPIDVHIDVS